MAVTGTCTKESDNLAASKWPEATLGDHIDLLTGFPFKSTHYSADATDIRLLRGDNIGQGFLRWDGAKRWPKKSEEHLRYLLQAGDIVLAMDRPWIEAGLKFAEVTPYDVPALLVQRVARLRGTSFLDTRFLRYVVGTKSFTDHIIAVQTGTGVPHISAEQIKSFRFLLPPLPEQKAIARILGALDDKIELNGRMNETLEAVARAVFDAWFVNFDPVRARVAGRSGNISVRTPPFPYEFEDSSIGKIPKGWRVGRLEEVLDELETGSRPSGGVAAYSAGVPSVGAENILGLGRYQFGKTKYVPREFYEQMKKGRVKSGDVLLYKDGGRPGEYEPHVSLFGSGFPFEELCINEHVYRLQAKRDFGQELLYFWLTSEATTDEMRRKGTGVAIPGLNSSAVRSLSVLIPPPETTKAFSVITSQIVAAILSNCIQSRTLTETRDTVLPKLLSGQIRLNRAEKRLEDP